MAESPDTPSLADDIEQWAEADESNARNYSFVTTASTMRERSRDLRAAAARLRKLDRIEAALGDVWNPEELRYQADLPSTYYPLDRMLLNLADALEVPDADT